MSDAQVVGRVAVKILPDTSTFKQDAEAELKKAERGLEVKAKVVLDGEHIKEQAKQIQATAQQALKDINLKVNLDNEESLRAGIARIQAELNKLDAVDINIGLNEGDLGAGLDMLRERLAEIQSIKLRIDESSQSSIQAAIAKIDAELGKLREIEIDVKVDEDELLAMRDILSGKLALDLSINWDDDTSIQQAIARIDAELNKLAEVELQVGLDEASLRQARADLQDTLNERIQIQVEADKAAAQRAYNLIQDSLNNIKINPKLDDADVAKVKRQLEAAFMRMEELKAKITPEMDAIAKAKVEREIDDLKDKIDGLKAEIEPETSKGAVALVMAEMAKLARNRIVNIIPKVSLSAYATATAMIKALAGARVLSNIFTKLGNVLKNLDKNVPIVGTLASAIAGLAAWAIAGASNLFALSASLAQIGATSLALPGILGGMAIGIGATIAAFKDFNKVLPQVKGQLSQLQDLISENFWAEAKTPIRELIDTLLPELTAGFEKTSTQLGQFFGGFADSLKSSLAPALGGMFDDLSKSIDIATTGTGAFANIIKVLGEVGAGYLPQLAQWFVDVSTKASEWLNQKGESGLREEIDQGIKALKDLGGVLYEMGGIFAGISRAATEAGGSTLGMVRETLAGVHEAIDSSAVQSKMVGLFTAAHDAMSNMAKAGGEEIKAFFGQFVGLLTQLLPQVGTILGTAMGGIAAALNQDAVFAGVYALFDGLEKGVNGVLPVLAPLGAALGAVMTIMGALAAQLGPLVAAALTPLAEAFTALTPAILPIVELLGGTLTGIFQQLSPIIAQLVPVVGEMLGAAFGVLAAILPPISELFMTIMTAVVPLVESLIAGLAPILPVVAEAFGQIITAVTPVADLLMQLFSAVITPLIPLFEYIVNAVMPPLVDAFNRVSEALQPFLQALIQVVNFLMPILVPALEFLIDLIVGSLAMALDGIVKVFTGVLDIIMGAWNLFAGLFTGDWSRAWDGIKQIFGGIWDIIVGIFEFVINFGIFGFLKKGLALIKSLWTTGWNAVKDFFPGLWSKIQSYLSLAWTGIRGLIDDGLRFVQNLWRTGWNNVKQFFTDAWVSIKSKAEDGAKSLWKAIQDGVKNAIKFVKELPTKAKDALKDLGGTLKDAGVKLIKGFVKGITSMFGGVKDALGNLTDKLTSWKGPESLDRVLLVNAGQLVINGFIKGLESRYGAVKKSLQGLTQDVADTAFDAPEIKSMGTARGVTSAVTAALAGRDGAGTTRVLNYYAAPGFSIDAEEDLFAAANRARMGW
ncbi:hypothetical protein [Streptomyces sp. NPDC006879]|uniref:hypothetical protein n=1 Tax=Streptomyces sp. NPDC006879 TaxID=3364767 RepID=UPI003682E0F3